MELQPIKPLRDSQIQALNPKDDIEFYSFLFANACLFLAFVFLFLFCLLDPLIVVLCMDVTTI